MLSKALLHLMLSALAFIGLCRCSLSSLEGSSSTRSIQARRHGVLTNVRRDTNASNDATSANELQPLSFDLSSSDPNEIQSNYAPPPLSADAIAAIQVATNQSEQDTIDGVHLDATGAINATSNNDDPDNTDSTVYTLIPDISGNYLLYGDADGNFNLAPKGSQGGGGINFIYDEGVNMDDEGRLMFYYPQTLSQYGVSRFRLNDYLHIPRGTRAVSLVPIKLQTSDAHPTFMASDTEGNLYSLLTCSYADGVTPNRVFLAHDPIAGAKQLQNPAMQATVTGGAVNGCAYVQFIDVTNSGNMRRLSNLESRIGTYELRSVFQSS